MHWRIRPRTDRRLPGRCPAPRPRPGMPAEAPDRRGPDHANATQQPQQVDYVAGPMPLFAMGTMTPILEQGSQHLLRSVISMVRLQLLDYCVTSRALRPRAIFVAHITSLI